MTYKEVRRGMDPDRWKGRRRAAVLGYWREIKLGMWDDLHASCEEAEGVGGGVDGDLGDRGEEKRRSTMRAEPRASAGGSPGGRIQCRKRK